MSTIVQDVPMVANVQENTSGKIMEDQSNPKLKSN